MAVSPMPEQLENDVSEVDAVPLMVNFNYLLAFLDPAQTGLSAANFDSTLRLLINDVMHGQIEGGTDLHDASAISLLDTALDWDAVNLEALAIEIAGIVKPPNLPADGGIVVFYEKKFDAFEYVDDATVATIAGNLGTVTILADSAIKGIKIELCASCYFANAAGGDYSISISINENNVGFIALSTDEYKMKGVFGETIDTGNTTRDGTRTMVFRTADTALNGAGWDGTKDNIIAVGPIEIGVASVAKIKNISMIVSVIT